MIGQLVGVVLLAGLFALFGYMSTRPWCRLTGGCGECEEGECRLAAGKEKK